MKNTSYLFPILFFAVFCNSCSNLSKNPPQTKQEIQAEIERILEVQESAYGDHSPASLQKIAATCSDSLIFIGGDDGGMMTSSTAYVHDLADGYIEKPHDRFFRIYDHTAIVTSLHQAYKLLAEDTLLLNVRATKVFVKEGNGWKMAYVTYAPLPVLYNKIHTGNAAGYAAYEGVYKLGPGIADTITAADGKLISRATGAGPSELLPLDDSTFIGQGYFGKTIFARDSRGQVSHYTFEWIDGQRIIFSKIR